MVPLFPALRAKVTWKSISPCLTCIMESAPRAAEDQPGDGLADQAQKGYYESFTNCTEVEANMVGCYWPNPLAQGFMTSIHRQFFSNCTVDRTHWEDPPDEVLIPLIVVPVLLTVAMAGLVVWRSKRTDRLL
ncbi:receptor activity-modifying protein 3 isoform X2 [Tupaia chinensis]|uniref:receptor activity-modifying protein 3 isoform X2 n=1 Tax=Tupaia chinensis TaxID=246437 RepID=UPI000FFBC3C9|nr:receptor activity-modifying protein 3 isoform X2 [Tupaia chinensis]